MKYMPNMDVYMDYCANQSSATKTLRALRTGRPELEARLKELRQDPVVRNLDLSSYLPIPTRRIARYPILLRQIAKYSESDEDRANIEHSTTVVEGILSAINERIRDRESDERLEEISKNLWIGEGRLDLTAPTRIMGKRRLLKEGPLTKTKSGRKLQAFLFNDIFMLTDASVSSLYRMPLPLGEIGVKEMPQDDLAFAVAITYPRGGDDIRLRATSLQDCRDWINALEGAKQAEKRYRHPQALSVYAEQAEV
ncbi:hypothetical protein BOTBODRAFT_517724 [Botryobasidium botryosum FD-172 SS1]|uniref:DH domain-containing protein n=1 Tax=Botryobasidium botryosum (strain FD-172 SS1) TaxID=930990 RepID=A0A067MVC6_BOTB1|nr:hypothetical protein BOTBODRAFT_517724 [Botryobasidium botryosum FD-172 SS1]